MDIDLILTLRIYLMLLSCDPDILNKLKRYIKYHIQILLYQKFLKESIHK
jgi:hypothetical protein